MPAVGETTGYYRIQSHVSGFFPSAAKPGELYLYLLRLWLSETVALHTQVAGQKESKEEGSGARCLASYRAPATKISEDCVTDSKTAS